MRRLKINHKKLALTITLAILAAALLSNALPPTAANPSYTIRFDTQGFTGYSSNIITIDGTAYTVSDLSWKTFSWKSASTHTITAASSFKNTDSPQKNFTFTSWTNGNGLVGSSGTFTTPSKDTTVTLNYQLVTHTASFTFTGITSYSSQIVVIDGTTYPLSDFTWRTFAWDAGTTHTVQAVTTVKNTDSPAKYYNFSSWTNGKGLVGASGTFTMPASDVTVTATYAHSSSHVTFATNGLNNLNAGVTVLTVEGQNYDVYNVANINNVAPEWNITSTHTVTAAPTLADWDGATYYFQGWTNGNGLVTNSGSLTTPANDVTVTANYGTSPPTPQTQTATTLTILCNALDQNNITRVTGFLTSGSTGINVKTVTLSYFNGATWISIGSATTAADGNYTYAWTIPSNLQNNPVPVQAAFAGDSSYQSSTATTGSPGNGGDLTVLPESTLGSMVALIACFAGGLVFFKLRAKRGISKPA